MTNVLSSSRLQSIIGLWPIPNHVRPSVLRSSSVKFGLYVEVNEWCMTICSMTRSKVKVTSPWMSEIRPFSKAISSPIYNGGWQMTTDSLIRAQYLAQYLQRIGVGFLIFILVFLCHVTLKLAVNRSRPSVPYGANLY